MSDALVGRLNGPETSFEIHCHLFGDNLKGRIGSVLMGQDLDLTIHETGVRGRCGGFDLSLELRDGALVGQVGGEALVMRGVDRVTGQFGEGFSTLSIVAQQRGDRLGGGVGNRGHTFELDLGNAPGWLGALVGVVAYYAFEHRA